ncbi:MAG: hypothetical protein MUC87_08890 [Bacteroidia bacterium]|jgi:hypothetical protein|nr:hypothetical protein [Bacteroidia bacterium]
MTAALSEVRFVQLKCIKEINEASVDEEPYLFVAVVEAGTGLTSLPRVNVFQFGPYTNTDSGEVKTPKANENPLLLSRKNTVAALPGCVIVAALMENDNSDPLIYRLALRAELSTFMLGNVMATEAVIRTNVQTIMRNVLTGKVFFVKDDDFIAMQDIRFIENNKVSIENTLPFKSKQGDYTVTFRLDRSGLPG